MLRECPSLNWLEAVSLWSDYGLVWKGLPCRRKCVNGVGFKLFECPSPKALFLPSAFESGCRILTTISARCPHALCHGDNRLKL